MTRSRPPRRHRIPWLTQLRIHILNRKASHAGSRKQARQFHNQAKTLRTEAMETILRAALADCRGMVAIDLGANIGRITRIMARDASLVHAFEPDPWTVERLRENLADLPNIRIHPAAAGVTAGTVTLYRSQGYEGRELTRSESSSIMAQKANIDPSAGVAVEMIDFVAFLDGLDAPVGVIKIDIEGAEVALLEALLDHEALARVRYVFVETHVRSLPETADRVAALRRRAARIRQPVINLDWW